METAKKLKICLVASAGGHLTQLLRISDCWDGHEVFFITTSDSVRKELQNLGDVYVVGECNRQYPLRAIKVLCRCIRILATRRPAVIISTGAAPGCIACFIAKVLSAKVIWLDSITNVERVSLSGRLVSRIADLFLVQWPDLKSQCNRAECVGQVI